jgi:hypothetical protein
LFTLSVDVTHPKETLLSVVGLAVKEVRVTGRAAAVIDPIVYEVAAAVGIVTLVKVIFLPELLGVLALATCHLEGVGVPKAATLNETSLTADTVY